jgi:membrane protein implicated in regulation of membrane protease activity
MTIVQRWIRAAALLVVAASAVLAAACASKSVNDILADPSRYRDQNVSVSGNVEESFSFGNRGVYRVNDSTGQLWVVSEQGVPRKGARVKVTGRVREGFNMSSFGDRLNLPAGVASGLVLVESSHRAE